MKLTTELRAELKALAEKVAAFNSGTLAQDLAKDCLVLLADLEEAERENTELARMAAGMASTANCLREELATVRQQLAEAQAMNNAAAEILVAGIREEQPDHESPPEPVSQWDYEAGQMVFALRNQNTAALQSAIEQAVAPYKKLRDDMEAIAAGSPTIPFREFAMHALHDLDAALSAKEKSNGD